MGTLNNSNIPTREHTILQCQSYGWKFGDWFTEWCNAFIMTHYSVVERHLPPVNVTYRGCQKQFPPLNKSIYEYAWDVVLLYDIPSSEIEVYSITYIETFLEHFLHVPVKIFTSDPITLRLRTLENGFANPPSFKQFELKNWWWKEVLWNADNPPEWYFR